MTVVKIGIQKALLPDQKPETKQLGQFKEMTLSLHFDDSIALSKLQLSHD